METQEYGVQGEGVNGDVSHTMPMLGSYYYLIGLYATYISSGSDTSGSESSYTTEDESTTSERRSDSGNSYFQSLECMQHFTLMLNRCLLTQLLILLDYQTTASELWDSSSTTTSTSECSTSQFSDEYLPTYANLLFYSPAAVEQPQPTNTIFVPKECLLDLKLRCPPTVEITKDPTTEGYIQSFQDHLPPAIEDNDITIINTPPIIIEDSEDCDSDVICLD